MSPQEEEIDVFCFAHLLLQEFTAAKYISELEEVSRVLKFSLGFYGVLEVFDKFVFIFNFNICITVTLLGYACFPEILTIFS